MYSPSSSPVCLPVIGHGDSHIRSAGSVSSKAGLWTTSVWQHITVDVILPAERGMGFTTIDQSRHVLAPLVAVGKLYDQRRFLLDHRGALVFALVGIKPRQG